MHTAIVSGISRGLGASLAAVLLERVFTGLGIGAVHDRGRLVAPAVMAAKIVDKLVRGEVEHGRAYS